MRLGKDGVILAASHGTRKMSDIEIEKVYGRGRKKHIAFDYATHLNVRLNFLVFTSICNILGIQINLFLILETWAARDGGIRNCSS